VSNFLANLVKFLRRKFTIFSYFKIISTFNFQIRFFPQFVRNAGLPFPVPPQLLQLKYREIFNQFWLKKEHQKESEEISENLFNSLLQKAFRGEL